MLKLIAKILVFLFCIIIFATCIDPYYPELGKYKSLLVVEGMVTDADTPACVRITRTFQSADSIPRKITDALVYITDEEDTRTDLYSTGDGNYKSSASSGFKGQAGKIYTLHIETTDGEKYLSEPSVMFPVPGIDSVYFARVEEVDKNNNSINAGIMIYLDTDEAIENEGYLRWEFEETWKFKLPSPKRYDYISDTEIIRLNSIREYCWKKNLSGAILTSPVLPGYNSIKNVSLHFISPEKSDRLTVQYSILVRQYSISTKEYSFWENLKLVNEATGDIFDTQPYPVISNIYNIDNPEEKILGYFKVSAVQEKRIYILPDDLRDLDIPEYKYPCYEFIVSPENYPPSSIVGEPPTWDEINEMFMAAGGFVFVRPIYIGLTKEISRLVFASEVCSDCSKSGSITPPDFWIDLP